VDYDTIEGALSSVSYGFMKQVRDVCVLLRPGSKHVVTNTLCIDTSHSGIVIRIETMRVPTAKNSADMVPAVVVSDFQDHPYQLHPLKIHTSKRDLPLFKVVQGELHVSNLEIRHSSDGYDIWNGNAAIHIEPRNPDATLRPTRVCLRSANVTSETGRGVVLRGDARLSIFDSYIHHCAGTGIYVGFSGHGSLDHLRHPLSPEPVASPTAATNADDEAAHEDTYRAVVRDTDIVENGVGNRQGPVGRGHSGVYLEEGRVELSRCSVVRNSSSGISVASSSSVLAGDGDNDATGATRLDMSHCYLVNNGGTPLEVTRVERHQLHQNVLSFTGAAPVFSSVFLSVLSDRDSEDESEVDEL
jgi:Right handed beta helix region